jgi:hypothetical protein
MPSQPSEETQVELPNALRAWGSDGFNEALKSEIEHLPHHQLPLQQGLQYSSLVSEEPFQVMILSTDETDEAILVRAGLFYSGVIAGCSCADDPTPLDLVTEHCTIEIRLEKQNGRTRFMLLPFD